MKLRRAVFLGLTILMILFIWGQSLMPKDASSNESGWVKEYIIQPVFTALHLGKVSEHFVRKLAHGTEFFVLNVFMSILLMDTKLRRHSLPFCFLTAFLDESIQILSGRGPMIQDVWIDMIGAAAAFLLCLVIFSLQNKSTRT